MVGRKEGVTMCKQKRNLFFGLLVFSLFSLSAFSQDGRPLALVAGSSELSDHSFLEKKLKEIPMPSSPQIDPALPLEKRQAILLKAWIEYYKAVEIWRKEVEASWNKAKTSFEKMDAARVLQINSRDVEIQALRKELNGGKIKERLINIGVFFAGYGASKILDR